MAVTYSEPNSFTRARCIRLHYTHDNRSG